MTDIEMTVPFGKYKGNKLCDLPVDYVWWLTQWEMKGRRLINKEKEEGSDGWLKRNWPVLVEWARVEWKYRQLCCVCKKRTLDGETAQDHWGGSFMHDKCWKQGMA